VSVRILIVDDERQITRVLRTSLASYGYEVFVAQNGMEAFDLFEEHNPNLIITDLSMPEMDGVSLTQAVRRVSQTPIIVLSVREQETTKVAALDSGADDYITKPFGMPELLARVRAQLRRVETHQEKTGGAISEGEFVLNLFLRDAGRVLTHKVILRAIWGPSGEDQPEYLRVLVAQLRKKIDRAGMESHIESEPWVGYRFRPESILTNS